MPAVAPRWLAKLRRDIHALAGRGWSIKESRGKFRLSVRRGADARGPSVVLPLEWGAHAAPAVLEMVGRLHALVEHPDPDQRRDLKDALALLVAATSPSLASTAAGPDWAAMVEAFRVDLQEHGNRIGDRTWKDSYGRFLEEAVRLLQGPAAPHDAYTLAAATLRPWAEMPRSRQVAVDAVAAWLSFCRRRHGLSATWVLDPEDRKRLKGRPPEKRVKATLTDLEILHLIQAAEAAGGVGPRWANSLRLLATFGLRPEELHHLIPRTDEAGNLRLWCAYRKTAGSRKTAPRWLHAMPLVDAAGEVVPWSSNGHLPGLLAIGQLPLPAARSKAALGNWLADLPAWQELVDRYAAMGQWLRPYCFRDSYSLRCHRNGIEVGSIAQAMGHSLQVHASSYRWASEETTAEAFALQQSNT